jgi:hypothetical protein
MDNAADLNEIVHGVDAVEDRVGVADEREPADIWLVGGGGSEGEVGKALTRRPDHVLHALCGLAVLLGDVFVDFANVAAARSAKTTFIRGCGSRTSPCRRRKLRGRRPGRRDLRGRGGARRR